MKRGDQVNIYEDPLTEKKFEGTAQIIRKEFDLSNGLAMYTVEFLGYEGIHLQRRIKEERND